MVQVIGGNGKVGIEQAFYSEFVCLKLLALPVKFIKLKLSP